MSDATVSNDLFTLQDVSALLGVNDTNSDSLYALCPVHDDNVPSLSVTVDADRLLAYCHVCCQSDSPKTFFVRFIQKLREISNNGGDQHPWVKRAKQVHRALANKSIVASYEYADGRWVKTRWQAVRTDADGELIRWFTWSTLDANGVLRAGREGFDGSWYRLGPDQYEQVWICEGESDAGAMHAADSSVLVLSPPDGAFKNSVQAAQHTSNIWQFTDNKPVTIVADNDEAGKRHALLLRDCLIGHSVSIQVLVPHEHKDLRELLESGGTLADGLVELDYSGNDQLLAIANLEGTNATGYVFTGPGGFLSRQRPNERNAVVLTSVPVQVAAISFGSNNQPTWHLSLTKPDGIAGRVSISTNDLSGPAAFTKWNANNGAIFIQTKNPAEVQCWLNVMGTFSKQLMFVKPGQVDIDGVPALVSTDSQVLWSASPIETDIETEESQDRHLTRSECTPQQSAQVVASILGFRDLSESAPALCAILATTAGSVLTRLVGRPLKIVEIVGISGTAKTSWTRLAVRLTGYSGSGTSDMTKAAFSRMLSEGLTTWVDDLSSGPESEAILADLRGKATGGERRIADRDQATGTISQKMHSGLVITWEGSLLGQTRAELDRRVSLNFEDTAVSARVDVDGNKQWLAMQRLGADNPDEFMVVGQHASNVLIGLCQYLQRMDPDPVWLKASGERSLVPVFAVSAVSKALAGWLSDNGHQPLAEQMLVSVQRWADHEIEHRREIASSGSDLAMVRLLEAYVGSPQFQSDKQNGRAYWPVPQFDVADVRNSLCEAVGHVITQHPPSVVVLHTDSSRAIAVCTASVLSWSTSEGGHRARVSEAIGGRKLDVYQAGNQLKAMASPVYDPIRVEVARTVNNGDRHTKVRRTATYRVISVPPSLDELL